MTLRRSTDEKGNAYEGGGFIDRRPNGLLNFTLYSAAEPDLADMFRSYGPLGELIAEDEYYNLTAIDTKGRCWESKRILPDTDGWADGAGIVIDGPLDSVNCTTSLGTSSAQCELDLGFFDDIEIPGNTITEVTTIVGGELRSRRSRWDVTRFTACGCRFEIRSQEGIVRILASAVEKLPPNLPLRVSDALQFILALPL